MRPIKKIMTPIAFSPYSKGIIDFSAMLAERFDVEQLLFVHIINQRDVEAVETIASFGYQEINEEQYIDEIEKQRTEELNTMLEDVSFASEKMKLIISVGNPAQKLLHKAIKEEADMIVMGVKARSEFMHALTGSVAEKIFRRSPITVVSYRDEKLGELLRKRYHL